MAYIHGHARDANGKPSREYRIWCCMKTRCYNKKGDNYSRYGGNGIIVCEQWRTSFLNFISDMGLCPPNHQLDRFPNKDGNYEPGNCRWATGSQNCNNKKNNRIITLDGVSHTVSEWARLTDQKVQCLFSRLHRGLTDWEVVNGQNYQ
jgi:hypothetical protein